MMSIVLWQTLAQSYGASSQQINDNELAILELVTGISRSALITEEYAELQPYIEHLISKTQITRLFLTDDNKNVVVSSNSSELGHQTPEVKKRPEYNWQIREIKNASSLMGTLAIEFSSTALNNAYADARNTGITIALIGMLIIATAGLLVGFLLTRRLAIVTATAQRLADGDFTARTNLRGRDELGQLAETFDFTVQGLIDSKYELIQTLESLQEREQNLTITLNSIGDAVIVTDADGNITRMNPIAEQLTGWTLAEAQKQQLNTIFPIIDASTRETIPNPVDKVLATGETIYLSNHTTLIARDGTEYQIADSAAPIRHIDSDNKIIGMVLVFNDVTEQYQLREVAAKSKRNLLAIMDNSPSVIYVKDVDGKFTFINKKFEDLFHIQLDEIVGMTVHDVFPQNIADTMQSNDMEVLQAGKPLELEEITPHDDGLHDYASIKFPLFNDAGEAYAVCSISTDITERKQQEEQLRRSQKMDALGKLTGGVAHDYNNMLGVILGYAEFLETSLAKDPKLAKYVHEIRRAGERGAKLTQKLLSFSRQKSTEAIVLNINKQLLEERHMLEKTLTARIKLVYNLADDLWPVYLNNTDLEDTIFNLSINALHAMEGNGQLTFTTTNLQVNEMDARLLQVDAGDYVLLSIIDTGCGMDEKITESIFDPFFTTKGEEGTGLGLSQVYGFVKRSGGVIKVYSEPNHGSRFTIYFPRHHVIDNIDDIDDIDDKTKYNKATNLNGKETILVVDDETALLELICEILSNQGYNVFCADNGKQALEILENESIDLLLSDVIMPEMDGYQLAEIVQQKYPAVKIQLASGFSDNRHQKLQHETLHTNLLSKPYNSKTLLQKIRELLE